MPKRLAKCDCRVVSASQITLSMRMHEVECASCVRRFDGRGERHNNCAGGAGRYPNLAVKVMQRKTRALIGISPGAPFLAGFATSGDFQPLRRYSFKSTCSTFSMGIPRNRSPSLEISPSNPSQRISIVASHAVLLRPSQRAHQFFQLRGHCARGRFCRIDNADMFRRNALQAAASAAG